MISDNKPRENRTLSHLNSHICTLIGGAECKPVTWFWSLTLYQHNIKEDVKPHMAHTHI
jgi:hypothetical protein